MKFNLSFKPSQATDEREPRMPHFWEAMVSFLSLIVIMSIGIVIFEVDPHIPMFIGVIIAALVSLRLGYKWSQIEDMMIKGISRAMQAILILSIVGMMIGVWILSGGQNSFLRAAGKESRSFICVIPGCFRRL